MKVPKQRRPDQRGIGRLGSGRPGGVLRVLVTGAGGPAAIAAMKSLRADETVQLLAADMDPWAAGLYLVPRWARTLVPAGAAPGFAAALLIRCLALGVDVVLPTVDSELRPLAHERETFTAAGIGLLLAPAAALDVILDKLALAEHCAGVVQVPRTELFGPSVDPASWTYPLIVKPREGSGSRGIITVASAAELAALDRSPSLIVQEFLPGEEYSVDVLADAAGHVIASVPRLRARVDSGVSVAGLTVHDPEVEQFGRSVARATGVTFVANVQCKRDHHGSPALLEVNPRMPGTLGLTIASGVDMPRLALAALLGRPLPATIEFRERAVVRFLDELFLDPADISSVGLNLEAEVGLGTTITVLLPATDEDVAPYLAPADTIDGQRGHGETILLVEDEESLRQLTTRILTRNGYQVRAVGNGAEAVRQAGDTAQPITLLLTDMVMPGMLGNEVAARIGAIRPDVPALFMSGYAQPILDSHGVGASSFDILAKPFTESALLSRVRQAITRIPAPRRANADTTGERLAAGQSTIKRTGDI